MIARRTVVYLPPALRDALVREAAQERRTVSALTVDLIARALVAQEQKREGHT